MSKLKILDLFCGTGGFSHGFTKYNDKFEIVCAIDMLKVAAETTKLNHPNTWVINEDIRKLNSLNIKNTLIENNKNVDIIVGGPPCQGFSSIRPFRKTNIKDPRNDLFREYVLFVEEFQPKVFVLENVIGLATHNSGKTIEIIQQTFNEIGYDTNWRILNAANFGVPQKRERLILIGTHMGNEIIFPKITHNFNGRTIGYNNKLKLLNHEETDIKLPDAITLMDAISDLPYLKSGEESTQYYNIPQNEYQLSRRLNNENLTLHIATKHSDKMLEIIKYAGSNINCIPKELVTSGFSSSYSRLEADEPAHTLTKNFVHPSSNRCIHPYQDRALTPREGARIQSFDDDYLFAGKKTSVVGQIGNAVPPLLGTAIAKAVYDMLKR